MKFFLLLVLATILTATPVFAIDMNAEVFVTHKATLTEGARNEGTDIERFRIFLSHKFDDKWAFKGRFEFKAGVATPAIPEAHFVGTGILMDDDTVKFGVMNLPVVEMESALGNRWITKTLASAEGFVIVSDTQSGASYGKKFGSLNVTLFTLSGEAGDTTDSDDNDKLNGIFVDYKISDSVNIYAQSASYNLAAVGTHSVPTNAKNTTLVYIGVNYKSEMVDAGYNYETATYTADTGGTADKANTVMGVNGLFKKIGGSSTNLYAHYWTGYDKFADTGEETSSKMMFGPTWNLADNKINLGIFYEAETFQGDYKDSIGAKKEPTTIYVKMAAKF